MISIEEARTRVAEGAAYLDQQRPGWHDRIDIGTLTLHDPCWCIVGQLCPEMEFGEGIEAIGLQTGTDHGLDMRTSELGWKESREEAYQPLQDAWIDAIAARRHPVSEPHDALNSGCGKSTPEEALTYASRA